jgi:hypothetical protein
MGYGFTVERKPFYLHIRVAGDNSPATVERYLGDIRIACVQHHCHHVLIEECLAGPSLSTLEVFEVIAARSRDAWPAARRIAYVDTNPEHDASLMEFAETVAVNRGVRVRVFPDVGAAERWLMELPGA